MVGKLKGANLDASKTVTVEQPVDLPATNEVKSSAQIGAALLDVESQRALQRVVKMQDPAPGKQAETYDYVFVGAGATGGTAAAIMMPLLERAAELRKQGFKVLVLEGGVDKEVATSKIPVEHGLASEHPDLLADPNNTGKGTGYWVKHYSNPEDGKKDLKANDKGEIWKPRGEGFGGSTRMNANVFVRVDDVDWDKLALLTGDPALRAKNMVPLLQELEKAEYRPLLKLLHKIGQATGIESLQNMRGHGFDGVLETTTADPKLLFADKQLAEIALKTLWWSSTHLGSIGERLKRLVSMFDPNDDRAQGTEGAVLMPTSIRTDGKRNGARDILLEAAKKYPDQLSLRDGARAKNVVLDESNRCTGVVYVDKNGEEHHVNATREVILAAGSLETPALLMRSGIGPKKELDKLADQGVKPRVILEGVGQNQGDRYEVGVVFKLKEPFKLLQDLHLPSTENDAVRKQWEAGQGGPLATNGAIASFQMRSDPKLADPDLYVFAVPGSFQGYKPGYATEAAADPHMLTFLVLAENKGKGKGTLEIDPNNPLGAPIINHHFHKERDPNDSAPLIAGVQRVRELVYSQFPNLIESEKWPGSEVQTTEQLKSAVESQSWGHHPRGGAQMGHANESSTVVDSDFRVIGTTGLRVIDASIPPDNMGSFIVTSLYQFGNLAGKKIARDALDGPKPAASYNALSIQSRPKPEDLHSAQSLTKETADAAKSEGVITPAQHERLTDGTVSKVDVDVAWAAISALLDGPQREQIGSDRHTIAHNLLIAVTEQLDKQPTWTTRRETFTDQVTKLVRRQ